jgi:phosphoglycerol transferase
MIKRRIKTYTRLSAYWLAFVLLFTSSWLGRKFGHPNFEQVLYHLQFGNTGLIDVDQGLIWSFIRQCLLAPILPTLLIYSLESAVVQIREIGYSAYRNRIRVQLRQRVTRISLLLERLCFQLFRRQLPLVLIVIAAIILLTKLSAWSYILSLQYTEFFRANYVTPSAIQAPRQKKNLVLIYAESMEQTYADRSLFGSNLIEGLKVSGVKSESIERFVQTPGTGWTIAGIVSSQCGVPLRPVTMRDGNASNEHVKTFMSNATCLGDVLKRAGYTNIFMGGAGLDFAGKGKFLLTHGYDQVYGKTDWREQGETQFNEWGLYDDRLFANAKKKIDQLEAKGELYNLTLLTVDMHAPTGFISDTCKKRGANDYQSIIVCSADMLGQLISYMHQRGYTKNTDIVVIGDHLSMGSPLEDRLEKNNERTIFNRFYTQTELNKNRSILYHYDLFPSILYILGFRFPENRLALGASVFGPLSTDYRLDKDDHLEEKLKAPSGEYAKLWTIPAHSP